MKIQELLLRRYKFIEAYYTAVRLENYKNPANRLILNDKITEVQEYVYFLRQKNK